MADNGNPVRVVVVGDKGTGKTSLIKAAQDGYFSEVVPPVVAGEVFLPNIPVTILDTSLNDWNDWHIVVDQLRTADVVILTYANDIPATRESLLSYWLHTILRDLQINIPVIVAACMFDTPVQDQAPIEEIFQPTILEYPEIEYCIECSAYYSFQVQDVFILAKRSVLYPKEPLFDKGSKTLKPRCVGAINRIFMLCDHDRDGALNHTEFNDFQIKCFPSPLERSELERNVQEVMSTKAADERALTLASFRLLLTSFIERGNIERTWNVFNKFGYNNALRHNNELTLTEELLSSSFFTGEPDQSFELTNVAIKFLDEVFRRFDEDRDYILRSQDIDELFSYAPENPWTEAPYEDAWHYTSFDNGLSDDAFLSMWSMMTLLEPARTVNCLIYIGFPGNPATAICRTRTRSFDRKNQLSERNIWQCYVFGPNENKKTALLNCFISRSDDHNHERLYAVKKLDEFEDANKYLVMRKIPGDRVEELFSNQEFLAACDIAVLVYDNSDEESWRQVRELLLRVATLGEATGYKVPCLMVSARNFHVGDPLVPPFLEESKRMAQHMGIEPPISIGSILPDSTDLFHKIVTGAQHPHLSIPVTRAGKIRIPVTRAGKIRRLIKRSLMAVSIGSAGVIVGVAAYRVYASRKSSA